LASRDCEAPGVKVYEKVDASYTADQCSTICFNRHADWFSVKAGDGFCYCFTGACGSATVAATHTLYKLE
jgi:hypothetical protein